MDGDVIQLRGGEWSEVESRRQVQPGATHAAVEGGAYMNPQNPNDYVAALKQKGADDQAVIAILRNAGWPEKEAVTALASYYEAQTGLAIPARPRSVGGPREAFLHLLRDRKSTRLNSSHRCIS